MPQVVVGRPSWSSTELESFCSLTLGGRDNKSSSDQVFVTTGTVYLKAVMDHKYDGMQLRQLMVSLVRRQPSLTADNDSVDTLREVLLRLPVRRALSRLCPVYRPMYSSDTPRRNAHLCFLVFDPPTVSSAVIDARQHFFCNLPPLPLHRHQLILLSDRGRRV